jgi:hypothetical protein
VPGAERGHDQTLEAAGGRPQQFPVVAQGEDDQADAHLPRRAGHGYREPPGGAGEQAYLTFDDPADRPCRWRGERPDAGGVGLADVARGVDLVGEHHHAAEIADQRADRRLQGRQDVGRPVGPGHGGVTHRPRHDDRLSARVQQVEQERGFLESVGALDHYGADRARRDLLPDGRGQVEDVTDGQGRPGHPPEVVHLDPGAEVGQAGHRVQELLPGQRRDHPADPTGPTGPARPADPAGLVRRLGHGDGAAEGEHRHVTGRRTRGGH